MIISTAFGRDLADTNCVNCGQCAAVCPTGAITIKNDTHDVWEAIHEPEKTCGNADRTGSPCCDR